MPHETAATVPLSGQTSSFPSWRIEPGGPTVRRTGFETALPLRAGHVVALDARGQALGSYRLR